MAAAAQSAVETTAAKLLDFSQPLDVALLDATVNAFYGAGSNDEVPHPPVMGVMQLATAAQWAAPPLQRANKAAMPPH